MLRYKVVVSLLFVFMVVVACQPAKPVFECKDKIGCVTIAPNAPLKIGMMHDLSGSAKGFGILQGNITELALAEKNNQFLGHPIALTQFDEKCSAEGGANGMLTYMADPQIVAILGPTCSAAVMGAGAGLDQSGLVLISGMSSAAALTSIAGKQGQDWHAGFFRTVTNGSLQGHTAAVFAFEKLGLRKVGAINDGDIFTVGLTESFKQTFVQLGGEVVAGIVNKGDTDMRPILTTMAKAKVDGIFIPLFQAETLAVYQQAMEVSGLEKIIFLANSTLLGEALLKGITAKSNPLYLVDTSKVSTPATQKLLERYIAKYGQPNVTFYSVNYDAVNVLLNALEQVAIKEDDGTLHVGRQALRDALYNTKEFESAAGKLTCDKFGDCGVGAFDILQVDSSTPSVEAVKTNIVYTYNPQK